METGDDGERGGDGINDSSYLDRRRIKLTKSDKRLVGRKVSMAELKRQLGAQTIEEAEIWTRFRAAKFRYEKEKMRIVTLLVQSLVGRIRTECIFAEIIEWSRREHFYDPCELEEIFARIGGEADIVDWEGH